MATEQREYEIARRTRYFAVVACRAGGVLLIVLGAIQMLTGILFYVRFRSNLALGVPSGEVDMYSFLTALIKLVPGVVLAMGSTPFARWIAPVPDFKCLRCDYDAQKSRSERCPECGALMGVEFDDAEQ